MEDFKFSTLEYKRPDFEKQVHLQRRSRKRSKMQHPMEN